MSSELVKVSVPSLAMSEAELVSVLGASVYPGAKLESIKLVIGYCRARQLDPLQKPVHIVPMDVKTGRKDENGKDIYEKRDAIMPGVGLYRTDAVRTGAYAGKSEPEFGPEKTIKLGKDNEKEDATFPEWCKVTVRRVVAGQIVEFTAKELWIENYATAGNWTTAPNKMWKKRPFGQLAKCAEAQALRMAFPEAVGAQPTAEEMEGKTIDEDGVVVIEHPKIEGPKAKSEAAADTGERSGPGPTLETCKALVAKGDTDAARDLRQHLPPADQQELDKLLTPVGDGKLLQEGQKRILRATLVRAGLTDTDVHAKFGKKLDEIPMADFNKVSEWAQSKQSPTA